MVGWVSARRSKNDHSENGTRYFEEIRKTSMKLKIDTFRLRTDRSGRLVLPKTEDTLSHIYNRIHRKVYFSSHLADMNDKFSHLQFSRGSVTTLECK